MVATLYGQTGLLALNCVVVEPQADIDLAQTLNLHTEGKHAKDKIWETVCKQNHATINTVQVSRIVLSMY